MRSCPPLVLVAFTTAATAQTVFTANLDAAIPAEIAPGTAALAPVQGFAGLGPAARPFAGSMLRSPTGNTITLSLTGLPAHDILRLDLLFAAIDSLDGAGPYPGGDFFTIAIDGTLVFRESFANASPFQVQTYVPPAGVELARLQDLGFAGPGGPYRDSAYWLGGDPYFAAFAHSGPSATITFGFPWSGQPLADESWAIDELRVVAAALQPSVAAYGFSCGPILGATWTPQLGQTLGLQLTNLPLGASLAFGAFGFSRAAAGPFVLPLPLDGFGASGCWLLQDAGLLLTLPFALGPGIATGGLAIPNSAALDGLQLYHQGWVLASAANTAGVVTSNGLRIRVAAPPVPITISETFATAANLDPRVSSGSWNNGARPGPLGGDGRHGSFDPAIGVAVGANVYRWDTALMTIPASHTHNGQPQAVTDGRFFFTDFVLPAGVTVEFVGPVPAQVFVRGQADVQGTLRLDGADLTTFNARGSTLVGSPFVAGQPGGAGGAGGGRGGKGGDECQGFGPIIQGGVVLTNGQPGEDVRLLAGHAYAAMAAGTGGRGSTMNPPTGIAEPNTPLLVVYRAYFAPGGGGGGFATGGVASSVAPFTGLVVGPVAQGGTAFSLMPFPPVAAPPGYSSLNHFLVGGSGGGGGATHAFGTIYTPATTDDYVAGAGGSGGGGACALRAGGDLTVAASAVLQAKGGRGVLINGRDPNYPTNNANWGVASPGGGGSGGSFLLQAGGNLAMAGALDTSGGNGSSTGSIFVPQYNVTSFAGAGSAGSFRLEAAGALSFTGTSVPAYVGAQHGGSLADQDPVTGCQSRWRSAGVPYPQWLRYELDVDADGDGTVDITYTDSGAAGTQVGNDPNGPVRVQFQGAQLDAGGVPLPGTTGPWRFGIGGGAVPGIVLDAATGFRFVLLWNRAAYPNCVVRALRVFA